MMIRFLAVVCFCFTMGALPNQASAAQGACGKRVCVELKHNLNHAYLEIHDLESGSGQPIVVPLHGADDVDLRSVQNAKNASCDMSADQPSNAGATNGQVTSTAVTCTYSLPGNAYDVVTTTFTWRYDSTTGIWALLDVDTKTKVVKFSNQEK